MKLATLLTILAALPASLSAQALPQLNAAAGIAMPVPAEPAAPVKAALQLLNTATGKVETVIPVGGGFIYASTGKFQPAAYNGSGYILPGGQYLPVVGGLRAKEDGLTGRWTGWGEWTYQGSGAHCSTMWLAFDDKKDYLERKGGYFDCGFVGLASEPAKFTKKGTQLLDVDGNPAGSYEGNVIKLNEAYSETVDIATVITVSGLHFDYSEIWTEKTGREIYVITGRMFTGGK